MSGELPAGVPGVDVPRLVDWMKGAVPDAGRITAIRVIAGGRSNLTYGITLEDGRRVVLRRPPLGHVLPTAHDMRREHRVMSALAAGTAVPVPEPLAFCADEGVIGAPFYLMDHVDGRVLRTLEDAADVPPGEARALGERLAEVLAEIHLVDVEAVGLADFGRPSGYMTRQLRRWGQQWERSQEAVLATGVSRDLPAYGRLVARLAERMPAEGPARLVHGDYRLDNALARLAPRPEIAAVVDWEMSTLGDPLADLGLTLLYWADAGDEERGSIPVGATATAAPGFLDRRGFAERYAEITGFDLSDLDFYVAFACFKLAVILEGIHARYLQNATVGEGFDKLGDSVPVLLDRAHHILDTRSPW
ncbi:phosphotransferase family protein [Thermomonospora umbrina]|uniref:Aminoglycoside phosphotransferase (APT) family kinase protein n=1 Tax=Thermomonospora umbrina TaxID=111806 RepID=A0A3D9SPC4_9ACTN|nr:phosphotransferase family protein [Thermomonospora umbrina]REE95813.1 aminoglycoside phosphotransferase (APT) family kinase protein [Thermomonospora umbrina]